jgi:hypothetical protein
MRSRLQNLKSKKKKDQEKKIFGKSISHPSQIQTAETLLPETAVFDEPDMLDTVDVPTIMSDSDSKGSCVEIIDGGSDVDIYEETALTRFSRILHDAQKKAQVEDAAKGNKWKTSNGNSWSNIHRRKCYQSDLAAKGYLLVHKFIKRMESKKKELTFEELEESSDNDAAVTS